MRIVIDTEETLPLPIAGLIHDIKQTLIPYSRDARDVGEKIKFTIKYLHYEAVIE